MNNATLQGTWNQMKGSVKEAFGKLTDDDMLKIEGSMDRAVGVLQQRYGYSKERAQEEWDAFTQRHNSTANSMTDSATNFVRDASKRVSDKVDQLSDKRYVDKDA